MPPTNPEEAKAAEIVRLQADIVAGEELLKQGSDEALRREIDEKRRHLEALLNGVPTVNAVTPGSQGPTRRGAVSGSWGMERYLGF